VHGVRVLGAAVGLTAAMTVVLSWAVLFLVTPMAPLMAAAFVGAPSAVRRVRRRSPAGVASRPGAVAGR